jgi:hypothetical protein
MIKFKLWYSPTQPLSGVVYNYLKGKNYPDFEYYDSTKNREETRNAGIRFVPTIQVLKNDVVISDFKSFHFDQILKLNDFTELEVFIENVKKSGTS